MDLKKAFDTVNHEILLMKLNAAGVRGHSSQLFESYLANRVQFVSINGCDSETKMIKVGVPQGSVLGPLLFLVSINDMANLPLTGKLILFADDSSLFYPGESIVQNVSDIKHDLLLIYDYLRLNRLTVNIAKTQFINFRAPRKKIPKVSLDFNGTKIEECSSVKYLGLYISNTLNWNEHVDHVARKIVPVIGVMKKIRYKIPSHILRLIYFSLVHSHLNYLVEVWGGRIGRTNKLQILQNKALKAVYLLHRLFSTDELYRTASGGVLPIRFLHFFQTAVYVFKVNNKLLFSNILFRHIDHDHNTRSHSNLATSYVRTNYGKQRISISGPNTFNKLPNELRILNSIGHFKCRISANML